MANQRIAKVTSGLSWAFGERILAQGVTFIVSIVIARILSPEEYGLISLVLVFINLANVFVENGFGESLIQKKDSDIEDFSTVFWCTLFFSIILYCILFIAAPYIGVFYDNTIVSSVLRVLSLKMLLASMNTIQRAYVAKHLQFEKYFFSTLGGTVISGVSGILLAYMGAGVWALVAQYLVNSAIDTLILFITVKWKPKFIFKIERAKILLNYSWKVTGAAFINSLYIEMRSLIIGRVYSSADLAYYNRGNQFPSLFITNINTAINTVFFPVMSSMQDNISELKQFARKSLKMSSYIIFPIMAGLVGVAEVLVRVLLTEKWLPCVPFLQILCIFYGVQPLQAVNWQMLKAVGRSDLCLKLEIIKKIIGFALVLSTMFISVEALTWSTTAFAIISMIINMAPNKRIVGYSMKEQFADILPNFVLSLVMGLIVWELRSLTIFSDIVLLIIQFLVGVIFYITASYILKLDSLTTLLELIKDRLHWNVR